MARCRPARAVLLVALLVAAGFASLAPTASAATVTEEARLPAALVGSAAAYVEGMSYVFGGRLPDGSYSDKIYKYDHSSGAVTEVATLPRAGTDPGGRQSGAAAALGGKIYYFGGAVLTSGGDINGDGTPDTVPRAIRDIVVFDPKTGSVTTSTTRLDAAAWGLTAAAVGGKIYLFGGFTFDVTRLDEIERRKTVLEFDGSSVKKLSNLPYAVQDASAVSLGGHIYLFGGLTDHHETDNPCPTYTYEDPDSGQTEEAQPSACLTDKILRFTPPPGSGIAITISRLPFSAQFLNAAVVDGKVYVIGGALPGPTATASIVEFDTSRASPVRVLTPTLPRGLYGAPSTSDGSTITLFGGRHAGYSDLSDVVLRVDPRATAPWAPRNLQASVEQGTVHLTWDAPAYDGGSPITGYQIYRESQSEGEEDLGTTTTLAYVDADAQPGIAYVYRVRSLNAAGEGASATTAEIEAAETPPGAVDALEVFTANGEMLLRWLPPSQTGGLAVSGYRIFRDDMSTPLASVGPSVREFRDTGLTNGVSYTYAVLAYNARGAGPLSEQVTRAPAAVPDSPGSIRADSEMGGGVRLVWDEPMAGTAEGYVVYRGTEPKHLTEIARQPARTYLDEEVEGGRTYYYTVAAYNDQGESPPTDLQAVSLVTPPGPPAQVIVSPGQGEIRLTWQAPIDMGGAQAADLRYLIKRFDASNPAGRIIATDLKALTYTDKPLQPGRAYSYSIAAMNPLEGNASEQKSATVRDVVNEKPEAFLAALPAIAKAGETIEFDASQSTDSDGRIAQYRFDFSDGSPEKVSERASVEHAFAANGTYYPTVVVVDDRGESSQPAVIQVIIGQVAGPVSEDQTLGAITGNGGGGDPDVPTRPGTSPTPAAGALALLAALGVAAAVLRRRA